MIGLYFFKALWVRCGGGKEFNIEIMLACSHQYLATVARWLNAAVFFSPTRVNSNYKSGFIAGRFKLKLRKIDFHIR